MMDAQGRLYLSEHVVEEDVGRFRETFERASERERDLLEARLYGLTEHAEAEIARLRERVEAADGTAPTA